MVTQTKLMTAEEFERMQPKEARSELVKGEIVTMSPAGHEHGEIALAAGSLIREFVRKNKLGKTYGAETGFVLSHEPDTVRAPDAAFVSSARTKQKRREGFFDGAPDLAVEVVSPDDMVEEIEEEILDYLNAGTKMIWIIHPRTKTITVYRSLSNVRVLTLNDALEGEDVVPSFSIPVKEIFETEE